MVFKYPEDPSKDYIKRVMAVGGDSIEIRDKQVFVNDQPVTNEPWAVHKDPRILPRQFSRRDNMKKVEVPEGKLFVMGDNRDNSHDSRFWGFVDLTAVKGEAFIIYWSWNKERFGVRWKRLGNLLL